MANLCERCKSQDSHHATYPCGRAKSTPRSTLQPRRIDRPVYVRTKTADDTCIVVGGGGRNGSPASLHLPTTPNRCNKLSLVCSGSRGGEQGRIQLMGNSVIKSSNEGLRIIPCKGKGGNLQIWMGGKPVLRMGSSKGGRADGSGGRGRGEAVFNGAGEGGFQLNFGKGVDRSPSITCGSGSIGNVDIIYGVFFIFRPLRRKLDMNHIKPTITHMIHRRKDTQEQFKARLRRLTTQSALVPV
ncbi:uncharacterized protein [Physcomitrium patens]|uniref:uncharacterized protein isoform X1 n=1 Tax=Physcomitrium patens TaxID=3218 RepID=UPI000D1740CA|nr:uncharacterized protein LOC112279677 isoform X1 [Physcomitrium patens]|eukprot:XP_024370092.1 uncharacterized protein LOC112279677 isoform X1 [Physcomitrella patens]